MKHKPHNLTFRVAVHFAAIAAGCALLAGQSTPLAAQDDAPAAATGSAVPPISVTTDLNALEVLKGVRDRLESLQYLHCELDETVHLSDLRFYAKGSYAQAAGNRVRLEFRIFPIRGVRQEDEASLKLDGAPLDTGKQKPTGELIQVSDGNTLSTYWKNGDSRQLTRRDIQEILKAADEARSFDRLRMFEDLGAGGLQSLLARLETGMEFGKVREQTVGDTRLLVVSGRWTTDALIRYFQLQDASSPRPGWMPDYVRIYIDAEARLPRRIQYLKRHPDPRVKQVRPLITLNFRGVTVNDEVDETQFHFETPQGLVEVDLTKQTIDSIRQTAGGAAGGPRPAPGAQPAADPATDSESAAPAKSDG